MKEIIIEFIKTIPWFIGCFIIFMFKKEISNLINKLLKVKNLQTAGVSAIFGEDINEENKLENEIEKGKEKSVASEADIDNEEKNDWLKYFIEHDYDKAIGLLKEEIKNTSEQKKCIQLESLVGWVLIKKDFKEGKQYLEGLMKKYPTHTSPYFWLFSEYKGENVTEKAFEVLDEGIKNVNDKEKLKKHKANYLSELGRLDDSMKLIDEVIKSNESDVEAYKIKAEIYYKKQDIENAIKCYKNSLKIEPKNKSILKGFAQLLYDNKKYRESMVIYERLTDIFPTETIWWTLLGNNYLELNFNSKAMDCYKKANELANGKEAWILANIGNLQNNRGFYSEAIEYLKKALEIDPDYTYTITRLSNVKKNQEDEEKKCEDIRNEVKGFF